MKLRPRPARWLPRGLLAVALLMAPTPAFAQASARGISLDEAIEIALKQSPSLTVASRSIDLAKVGIETASLPNNRSIAGFVNVDSQLPLTTIEFPDPADPTKTQSVSLGSPVTSTLGVSYRQPLLKNKQVRAGKRSAEETVQSAESSRETAVQDVIGNVKQAYYAVLLGIELRRVAEEQLSRNRQHLRIAEARRDQGVAPELEVMQAQVDVTQAEHALRAAEGAVRQAVAALNQAMGLEVTAPTVVLPPEPAAPEVYDFEPLFDIARGTRSELSALDHQIASAEWEKRRADTLDRPDLNLTSTYSYNMGSAFLKGNSLALGLALTVPFDDGGVSKATKHAAVENIRLLQAQKEALLQGIALEVESARIALQTAVDKLGPAREAVATAREAFRVAELAYQNDVGPRINVKDAQLALTQAESNLAASEFEYRQALAKVERAAGVRKLGEGIREKAGDN